MNSLSIFGSSGFIGKRFCQLYPGHLEIGREQNDAKSNEILYFISTTDNYNIFTEPHKDIDTNLNKLISVLEAWPKTEDRIFNFISSWFVYGKNASLYTTEDTPCDPTGFYSITKRAAEQMLICYCETFGIKYRIMRLTNIIGETDQGVSNKKNALQYMIKLLKNHKEVKLYDFGTNIRDYMYVDDACRAINTCICNAPTNEIINISNFEPRSIGSIINYCKKKLNSESIITSIEAPYFHKVVQVKNVCLSANKLYGYGYNKSTNVLQAVDRIMASL